jgi:hypothetical protein
MYTKGIGIGGMVKIQETLGEITGSEQFRTVPDLPDIPDQELF